MTTYMRFPSRAPTFCARTDAKPAHTGADKLVPPMQQLILAVPPTSVAQKTPGKLGLAISEIGKCSDKRPHRVNRSLRSRRQTDRLLTLLDEWRSANVQTPARFLHLLS